MIIYLNPQPTTETITTPKLITSYCEWIVVILVSHTPVGAGSNHQITYRYQLFNGSDHFRLRCRHCWLLYTTDSFLIRFLSRRNERDELYTSFPSGSTIHQSTTLHGKWINWSDLWCTPAVLSFIYNWFTVEYKDL